jgi:hypothetical protein
MFALFEPSLTARHEYHRMRKTGQRQGDLLRLPWSAYDGKEIRLRQRNRVGGEWRLCQCADGSRVCRTHSDCTRTDRRAHTGRRMLIGKDTGEKI